MGPERLSGRQSLGTRAARGTLWLATGAVATKGMQALVLLIAARELGPAALGLLSLAAVLVNLLNALHDLGITDTLTYCGDDTVGAAARTAMTIALGAGAVAWVIGWIAAPAVAGFAHAPEAVGLVRWLTVLVVCSAAATVPGALLTRQLNFRRRVVVEAVPAVTGGLLSIALLLGGGGVAAVVAGQVVQGILFSVLPWFVGIRTRPGWDPAVARSLSGYSRHVVGANLVKIALLNVDFVVVGWLLGPFALGLYSLAFRVCFLPYVSVAVVVNGAAFPYYCRLPPGRTPRAIARVAGVVLLLTAPLYAGLALFAGAVTLLGTRWDGAAGPIRFLAVYGLCLGMIQTGQAALNALGRPGRTLAGTVLHFLTLAFVLLVGARLGIVAVAIGQAAVAVVMVLLVWAWAAHSGGPPGRALLQSFRPAIGGVVAMLPVTAAGTAILGTDPPRVATMLVVAPMAIATYFVVAGVLGHTLIQEGWRALRTRPALASGSAS